MGGGVSLPAVPLNTVHKRYLVAKYAAAEEAVADGELPSVLQRRASAWLEQHLPGVILFDQMDSDHGGTVDRDELRRFLCALPRLLGGDTARPRRDRPLAAAAAARPVWRPLRRSLAASAPGGGRGGELAGDCGSGEVYPAPAGSEGRSHAGEETPAAPAAPAAPDSSCAMLASSCCCSASSCCCSAGPTER